MDLFDFLNKLDESGASYHFEAQQDGSALEVSLTVDSGGFFSKYDVKVRLISAGTWRASGLPDGDAEALFEAYELAERHGTKVRGSEDYQFTLEEIVDLIADVR